MLSGDAEIDVARRYVEGQSLSQIQSAYPHVSRAAVANALRRRGVPLRRRGATERGRDPSVIADIIERYQGGEAQWAIGQHHHIHQTVISRILRENGIEPRKKVQGRGPEAHGQWRGGRSKHAEGYVMVWLAPDDPMAPMRTRGGYVMEHRLVMARFLGRPLTRHETVHHIHENSRDDNRIENLQLRQGRHGRGTVFVCAECGSHNIVARPLADP